MKKLFLIIIYATLCSIPLFLIKGYFEITDRWWLDLLIYIFSFFNGSFLYTQFHGNKIIKLWHVESEDGNGTHNFKANLKESSLGALAVTGNYIRLDPFTDKELTRKLFNKINAPVESNSFKKFALDSQSESMSIGVDDYESPFKITLINIIKSDFKRLLTEEEIEQEFKGLSKYEGAMKVWKLEQDLLEDARSRGVEDELIAYWESTGKPRMKEPPKKEDYVED